MTIKDIRLSGYQEEEYPVIRKSGYNFLLISWCSDNHFLIPCCPDSRINDSGIIVLYRLKYPKINFKEKTTRFS